MATADLPLPDYDHLSLPSLTQRIRSLDASGVQALLDYEQSHGNRLPVVLVLQQRLASLDDGAEPSAGSPTSERPEVVSSSGGGSKISPATSGPPINPPSHGDPTNPAQPR